MRQRMDAMLFFWTCFMVFLSWVNLSEQCRPPCLKRCSDSQSVYATASRGSTSAKVEWCRPVCDCKSCYPPSSWYNPYGTWLSEGTKSLTYTGYWNKCKFVKYVYLHVSVRRCGALRSPDHGWIKPGCDRVWGKNCEYACWEGYFRATAPPVCEDSGNTLDWRDRPVCLRGGCVENPVSKLANADLVCDGKTSGSTCEYHCHSGYVIPRSLQHYKRPKCQQITRDHNIFNWTFDGLQPECYADVLPTVRHCPRNVHIKTGHVPVWVNIARPIFEVRGRVVDLKQYDCTHSEKELLRGPITRVECKVEDTEIGRWSSCSYIIRIDHIECPVLKPPTNGRIIGPCSNAYQMSCSYTCEEGYYNTTSTELTCGENRNWSLTPDCKIKSCNPPPPISRGQTNCTVWTYGAKCDYYCDPGYVIPDSLADSATITCNSDALWELTTTLPQCWVDKPPIKTNCSGDIELFVGTDQTQVTIPFPTFTSAHDGKVLEMQCNFDKAVVTFGIGSHPIICSATDHKINRHATCNFTVVVGKSSCPPMRSPEDGFLENCREVNGSQCFYGCQNGYRRTGPNPVICENGQWSADIGCTVIKCNKTLLANIAHAYVNCTGQFFGGVCTYSCLPGYILPIAHRIRAKYTCGSSGNWEGQPHPPECWVNQPPTVSNCSDGLNISSTKALNRVTVPKPTFTSIRGDALDTACLGKFKDDVAMLGAGDNLVECTGTDEEIGRQSSCNFTIVIDVSSCGSLDSPANGSLNCISLGASKICSISCKSGFDVPPVEHSGTYFCHEKRWSNIIVPDCVKQERPGNLKLPVEMYYSTNGSCSDNATLQQIEQNFLRSITKILGNHCKDQRNNCSVASVTVSCGKTRRKKRETFNRLKRMAADGSENKLTIDFTLSVTISKDENYTGDVFNEADKKLSDIVNNLQKDAENKTFSSLTAFNLTLQQTTISTGDVEVECQEGYFRNPTSSSCSTCPAGYFVDLSGKYPKCSECRMGEFQDLEGQSQCKPCPPGTFSVNSGSKSVGECVEINDCDPSPCQNDGLCIDGTNFYRCECSSGFTGENCTEFDCNFHECQNNGTCVANGVDYICTCLDDFIGDRCQHQKVHGGWGPWSNFTECTASCGSGKRQRTRTCTNPSPMYEGRDCTGQDFDQEKCNQQGCTVDGLWGEWSNWTDCSRACGGGMQNRTRACDSPPPAFGGLACEGMRLEKRICNTHKCPVDGGLGPWSVWTMCTRSCEGGEQRRNRSCDNPLTSNGGRDCSDPLSERRQCNTQTCPPPPICDNSPCLNNGRCVNNGSDYICNCPLGFTGKNCSLHDCRENKCLNNATCIGNEKGYFCLCEESFTGNFCELQMLNGDWGLWGEWSICVRPEEGQRIRKRTCDNPSPVYGGEYCTGDSSETEDCPHCQPAQLEAPDHGSIICGKNENRTTCTASCSSGYGFSSDVPEDGIYVCGRESDWLWSLQTDHSEKFEVPMCMEADDNQEAVATIEVNDLPCTEEAIQQVYSQINEQYLALGGPAMTPEVKCVNATSSKRKRSASLGGLQIVTKLNYSSKDIDTTDILKLAEKADALLANGTIKFDVDGVSYAANPNMMTSINCSEGSVVASGGEICVKCQPGTYFANQGKVVDAFSCHKCPRGYFQHQTGQLKCLKCDVGYSTDKTGAKSKMDCVICKRGTFFVDDLGYNNGTTCAKCADGFYQPLEGQSYCLECPSDLVSDGISCVNPKIVVTTQEAASTTAKLEGVHASTAFLTRTAMPATSPLPSKESTTGGGSTLTIIVAVTIGGVFMITGMVALAMVGLRRRAARRAVFALSKARLERVDLTEFSRDELRDPKQGADDQQS